MCTWVFRKEAERMEQGQHHHTHTHAHRRRKKATRTEKKKRGNKKKTNHRHKGGWQEEEWDMKGSSVPKEGGAAMGTNQRAGIRDKMQFENHKKEKMVQQSIGKGGCWQWWDERCWW